jgi:hypothetical protein
MTQISRPFQIALAVLVLFVAVWFLALHGHSSSGSGSEPSVAAVSAPAPASSSSAAPAKAATGAKGVSGNGSKVDGHKVHHAAKTGQPSLKHTIDKAQGAVKKHSQHKAQSTTAAKSSPKVAATAKTTPKAVKSHAALPVKATSASANTQQAVEAQLKQGKVVAVLFWSPKGTVDGVVRRELQAVSHRSHGSVAVHVARATEIRAFGSFARAVQVYSTPTILLINTKGKTSSLSGLTDTFGIEQAVREVKVAK